jgi:hypothetical protein
LQGFCKLEAKRQFRDHFATGLLGYAIVNAQNEAHMDEVYEACLAAHGYVRQ